MFEGLTKYKTFIFIAEYSFAGKEKLVGYIK